MKLTYTFKHMDASDALIAFAKERLERMEKYELKPLQVHFSFSMLRHERHCDVLISGADLRVKAEGRSDDIYLAVESALAKIERQLSRRKARVQHHKRKQFTEEAKLRRMSPTLDHDFVAPFKGARPRKAG